MDENTNLNQNQEQSQVPSPEGQPIKRTFMIGDEWLYYKFYSGPKTADMLLAEMIMPMAQQFLDNKLIDRWFFIRYGDPKNHIRVRFHITNPNNFTPVIMTVRNQVSQYIEQSLVWKVMVDTYDREVERYGINSMDLGEEIFFHDSVMIVGMLSMIEGDEGERIRWLFALRAVDAMLQDFGYDMEQRYEQVTRLRENFGREFNMNRQLKEQTEKKFRKDRPQINEVMDPKNDELSEMYPLFQLLRQKSAGVKPAAEKIMAMDKEERLGMPLNDLLASYSHMLINRLFKSKQRLNELVVYDFLHRYYKSEIARQKYAKINAQKGKDKKKKKEKKKG